MLIATLCLSWSRLWWTTVWVTANTTSSPLSSSQAHLVGLRGLGKLNAPSNKDFLGSDDAHTGSVVIHIWIKCVLFNLIRNTRNVEHKQWRVSGEACLTVSGRSNRRNIQSRWHGWMRGEGTGSLHTNTELWDINRLLCISCANHVQTMCDTCAICVLYTLSWYIVSSGLYGCVQSVGIHT